jgi:opacity protein-like surface antigen
MKTLKISTLVASVVAASALAGSAFAGQMNQDQNNFVNVGINGQYTAFSKANVANGNVGGTQQLNNKTKSVGYGATIGYEYALVPSFRLGAELGYEDLGKSKATVATNVATDDPYYEATSMKIKEHMFTALVTSNYFITPNWNVIGKFGPAWVTQKTEIGKYSDGTYPNGVPKGSYSAHKVAPYLNIGTAYHFDNMSVGVSYGHLFGSKIKSISDLQNSKKVLSSNSVQLDLGYTFPF